MNTAETIRAELRGVADPARAPAMQAYMKSSIPYLGVSVPATRAIAHKAGRSVTLDDIMTAARDLWRAAQYREERYAATALIRLPASKGRLEVLPLVEEMITTGAWWDHVDEVAHAVGVLLLEHPTVMRPIIERWARSPDRWLRRSAVISQLDAKDRTDLDLLALVIGANAGDPDFFLRKAIGWALRQYARTDPAWVGAFVASTALSPLSVREATKHLSL